MRGRRKPLPPEIAAAAAAAGVLPANYLASSAGGLHCNWPDACNVLPPHLRAPGTGDYVYSLPSLWVVDPPAGSEDAGSFIGTGFGSSIVGSGGGLGANSAVAAINAASSALTGGSGGSGAGLVGGGGRLHVRPHVQADDILRALVAELQEQCSLMVMQADSALCHVSLRRLDTGGSSEVAATKPLLGLMAKAVAAVTAGAGAGSDSNAADRAEVAAVAVSVASSSRAAAAVSMLVYSQSEIWSCYLLRSFDSFRITNV
jgi:hypothetical protein